jgi:hypothetical protein
MGGAADPRLEVGDDPNLWGPPVSERCKKKKERRCGWAGGEVLLGCVGRRPGGFAGYRKKEEEKEKVGRGRDGPQERKVEGREGKGFFFSNSFFKLPNFNHIINYAFET